MAASDAKPVPQRGVAYRFYFAVRKPTDSTLITTWTGQDSEVSLDGAAYGDCTNEATEIGTSGTGYIDLTAAEMTADCVLLKITVTNSGAVPLVFTFYPEEAGDYRVKLADAVTHGGTTAMLRLGTTSSTPALYITNSSTGNSVKFESSSSAPALLSQNTSTGNAVKFDADSGNSFFINSNTGQGFQILTGGTGPGMSVSGGTTAVTFSGNFNVTGNTTLTGTVTATGASNDIRGVKISGTTTTLDALQTALNSDHGSGSWLTATGFSTHSAADVWAVGTRTLTAFGFTVTAGTVSDKTGYSLTQSFPSNFASLTISAGGVVSADVTHVNGVEVDGSGVEGTDEWRPA